jgi:hypothetical protein
MVGLDVGATNIKTFTWRWIADGTLDLDRPPLIWRGLQNQVDFGFGKTMRACW